MQALPDDESEMEGQALQPAKAVPSEPQEENDVVQMIPTSDQINIFTSTATASFLLL